MCADAARLLTRHDERIRTRADEQRLNLIVNV